MNPHSTQRMYDMALRDNSLFQKIKRFCFLLIAVSGLLMPFVYSEWYDCLAAQSYYQWGSPIPDTGQTKCYDSQGNEIDPCPEPGDFYYGQDANYLINPPSYTKLDGSGNDLPITATEWVMVRDNVTGLIWEIKQNKDGTKDYSNPHDADNTYTWFDSDPATNGGDAGTPGDGTDTEDFIFALNDDNFGGFTDWRVPTLEELRSIVNYGKFNPAVDENTFSNVITSSSSYYWSSNTYAENTGIAWSLSFYSGSDHNSSKTLRYSIRAVRGGAA